MRMGETPIRVFDFWDYRKFIQAQIDLLKEKKQFSVRDFAKKVGFGSSGYLSMVLQKKRNLSSLSSQKVADIFKLEKSERKFFMTLVNFNQCLDFEEKDSLYKDLLKFQSFRRIHQIQISQIQLFSHWRHSAIFEALAVPLTAKQLELFGGSMGLSQAESQSCIHVLRDLGLAELKEGRWNRKEIAIAIPKEYQTLILRNYHREVGLKAIESLDRVPPEEREFGALTLALSQEKFDELRELVRTWQTDSNSTFSGDPNPQVIYQLNFQLFPLAKMPS